MDLYDKYKFSGGKMIFINMKPDVKRVFDLVGFMKYFIEASSFDEAMNNI
jgi:anti-anti-sigma regulatory factor